MKDEAMSRAEQYAREIIATATAELVAANNDLNVCAPFPRALNIGRNEYIAKRAKYDLYRALTTLRDTRHLLSDPILADPDGEKAEEYVKAARENAAEQYEAYVAKLVSKIGPATAARLEGNHVWGYSHLFVTTPAGDQIWKTQMILNQSKLGKVFNQFPTRLVKAAR